MTAVPESSDPLARAVTRISETWTLPFAARPGPRAGPVTPGADVPEDHREHTAPILSRPAGHRIDTDSGNTALSVRESVVPQALNSGPTRDADTARRPESFKVTLHLE